MIYEKITACGTPEGIPDCYIVSLGGSGVVSAEVEAELEAIGTVERVKGTPRYETSVEIAEYFFPGAESAVPSYAEDFPDGMCAGPLAHLLKMPLILTTNEWPTAADNYVGILRSALLPASPTESAMRR